MSNDPKYVSEPEKFIPERWIKGSAYYIEMNPFAFLPFGHGPRMCIGRRFAELETQIILVKV